MDLFWGGQLRADICNFDAPYGFYTSLLSYPNAGNPSYLHLPEQGQQAGASGAAQAPGQAGVGKAKLHGKES